MASKIFLDANIILDFALQRDTGYQVAKDIIQYAIDGKANVYITPAIVHIAGYYITKYHSAHIAKNMLLSLLYNIHCIEMTHESVVRALESELLDIEDALQYYTALNHKMDCFISRDKKFVKAAKPQLPVYDPATFIKKFMN